jgi:riboflavin kinase
MGRMMIVIASQTDITYNELATLKQLALTGALEHEVSVTSSQLSDQLEMSNQTVSRRLQRLEDAGMITRQVRHDGQWAFITNEGEQLLQKEHEEYKDLFNDEYEVDLEGVVSEGVGEGKHYISLSGYVEQFRNRLGYEPFPGTLNIELEEEAVLKRVRLENADSVEIDAWEEGERTYGSAVCHRATLETRAGQRYEPAHVLVPKRTHHQDNTLEIISEEKLRDVLDLDDEDPVTVRVHG